MIPDFLWSCEFDNNDCFYLLLHTIVFTDSVLALNAEIEIVSQNIWVNNFSHVMEVQGTWLRSSSRVFYVTFAISGSFLILLEGMAFSSARWIISTGIKLTESMGQSRSGYLVNDLVTSNTSHWGTARSFPLDIQPSTKWRQMQDDGRPWVTFPRCVSKLILDSCETQPWDVCPASHGPSMVSIQTA